MLQFKEQVEKLSGLVKEATQSKNFEALQKYCLSEEYQNLPYSVKNFPFITSSKLKAFERCPLAYKYEYIDLIEKPEGWDDKDYFIVGRAFDDLMTFGETEYNKRFVVVDRRVDVSEKITELEAKIAEAETKTNKDGSPSATALKTIESAKATIAQLKEVANKTQLTNGMGEVVDRMKTEFEANKLFNPTPNKKVLLLPWGGLMLKAELDDFQQLEDGTLIVRDIKTSANITTFDPEDYIIQATLYHWLVEEETLKRPRVLYEVVDKNPYFSRSVMYEYTEATLMRNRGRVLTLLDNIKQSTELGLFIQTNDWKTKVSSPYYGHEGYGRLDELIYY